MTEERPAFNQVNLVVYDMDASVRFYRLLGLDVPDPMAPPSGGPARHISLHPQPGGGFDLDNVAMARTWGSGDLDAGAAVIGFSLPSRAAVDDRYEALTSAGFTSVREPYDAFWGSRYAIVADPDGHLVGLMSPWEESEQYTPEI